MADLEKRNRSKGPEGPTDKNIEELRKFCEADLDGLLPEFAEISGHGTDMNAAREFILQTPPAVVVPRSQLREFKGLPLHLLEHQVWTTNPLAKAWLEIRHGRGGLQGIPEVKAQLDRQALVYTEGMMTAHNTLRQAGYAGFGHLLASAGFTPEAMSQLFMQSGELKRISYPGVDNAAEIMRQKVRPIEPLINAAQLDEEIGLLATGPVTRIIYPEYGPKRATATLAATISDRGDAEIRTFITTGSEVSESSLVHEEVHTYYALRQAQAGLIPTAISSSGNGEVLARAVAGVDMREALLFVNAAEAAWNFTMLVDQQMAIANASSHPDKYDRAKRQIVYALNNGSALRGFKTGMAPVPGSEVVPFGPFSVVYSSGIGKGLELRQRMMQTDSPSLDQIFKVMMNMS